MIFATNGEKHYKYRDIWPARRQTNLQTCHKHSQTDAFWGSPRVTANDSKHLRFGFLFHTFLGLSVCWRILDRYASTNKRRYAQQLLHRADFMRTCCYTERFVHRDTFTTRPLHTEAFMQRNFYTQKILHTDALHKDAFAPCSIDAQTLLHADAFTHRRLSGTNIFLHRNLGSFLQNEIFLSLRVNICTPVFELWFFHFFSFTFQILNANGWRWDIHVCLFVLWVPEKVLKVPEGLGASRFNEALSGFRCDSGSVSAQLLGQSSSEFRTKNMWK